MCTSTGHACVYWQRQGQNAPRDRSQRRRRRHHAALWRQGPRGPESSAARNGKRRARSKRRVGSRSGQRAARSASGERGAGKREAGSEKLGSEKRGSGGARSGGAASGKLLAWACAWPQLETRGATRGRKARPRQSRRAQCSGAKAWAWAWAWVCTRAAPKAASGLQGSGCGVQGRRRAGREAGSGKQGRARTKADASSLSAIARCRRSASLRAHAWEAQPGPGQGRPGWRDDRLAGSSNLQCTREGREGKAHRLLLPCVSRRQIIPTLAVGIDDAEIQQKALRVSLWLWSSCLFVPIINWDTVLGPEYSIACPNPIQKHKGK